MAARTPENVAEVEAPLAENEAPLTEEKERTMAAKEPVYPQGPQMPFTPLAMMGSNVNWFEMMGKNMESLHEATLGTLKYVTACQETTFALMRERMRKIQEMAKTCSDCREPMGLVHESAQYHQTMVEDYVRYAKRLGDMTLAAVNEQIEPLEKRTQETLAQVSKAA